MIDKLNVHIWENVLAGLVVTVKVGRFSVQTQLGVQQGLGTQSH